MIGSHLLFLPSGFLHALIFKLMQDNRNRRPNKDVLKGGPLAFDPME